MELNKDNLEKWVGALESGKWRQAHGALVREDEVFGHITTLCAVGVGMATMLEEEGDMVTGTAIESPYTHRRFVDWLGAHSMDLLIDRDEMPPTTVIGLNDGYQEPFPLIAQRIRKQYL